MSYRFLLKALLLVIIIFPVKISSAGTIDTVFIPSAVMNKQPGALIIVPDNYRSDPALYFPSVYLLHGWSGSFLDWNNHTDLTLLADRFKMIIICPDGGYAGWYLDSPYKADSHYETYIIREVIPFIQKHYRTSNKAEKRFICGLSMGGYGALRLIARYPELFAAAGSMSGVLRLNSKLERYGVVELLGDSLSNSNLWHENECFILLQNLIGKTKGLIIDCGSEDPFIEMNRTVHAQLLKTGIKHEYWERPGAHTWSYWINALAYHLLYFRKILKQQN